MKDTFAALEFCVSKLAKYRGLDVERIHRAKLSDDCILKVRRRSFTAETVMHIRDVLDARSIYDIAWEHIRRLDMKLRSDELRAVFDFTDDDDINFVGISNEEARRVGAQMIRAFMYLVRGDEWLRNRICEIAISLAKHSQIADIVESKLAEERIIANMPAADAEQLALRLMARVERLRGAPT